MKNYNIAFIGILFALSLLLTACHIPPNTSNQEESGITAELSTDQESKLDEVSKIDETSKIDENTAISVAQAELDRIRENDYYKELWKYHILQEVTYVPENKAWTVCFSPDAEHLFPGAGFYVSVSEETGEILRTWSEE